MLKKNIGKSMPNLIFRLFFRDFNKFVYLGLIKG